MGEDKALCAYCQCATLASLASLALAVPEVLRAARTLRGGGKAGAARLGDKTSE